MAGAFYGRIAKERHPAVSESYLIGIDISENGDTSVLTVSRLEGSKVTVVNSFMGKEAENMYDWLTNQRGCVIRDGIGGEENA